MSGQGGGESRNSYRDWRDALYHLPGQTLAAGAGPDARESGMLGSLRSYGRTEIALCSRADLTGGGVGSA